MKEFGKSKEFVESATHALKGEKGIRKSISDYLEASFQVAACDYEFGSSWGTKVSPKNPEKIFTIKHKLCVLIRLLITFQFGWIYGSMTEDILTGLNIHKKGWKSNFHFLDPPAFLGCAPTGGPAAMMQQKRWATGLLEILVSKSNPIVATLTQNLQFRLYLFYIYLLSWGLTSVPELCYAALPAYCIISNSHFLPKVRITSVGYYICLCVSNTTIHH